MEWLDGFYVPAQLIDADSITSPPRMTPDWPNPGEINLLMNLIEPNLRMTRRLDIT